MASRFRHLRAGVLKAVFKAHAQLYEASDGRIGKSIGPMALGQSTLLLSVTGRKSGLIRTTPLAYFEDGGNYIVVGSDGAERARLWKIGIVAACFFQEPHWKLHLLDFDNLAGQNPRWKHVLNSHPD